MILLRLRRFDRKPNAARYYSPPCSALRARVTFVSDSAQDGSWHDGLLIDMLQKDLRD
jgi:hypothetical protein